MVERVPVRTLTELFACKSKAKLTSMLRTLGLPAVPDALGWPIVLRDDLERALSSSAQDAASRRRKRPNLSQATM